MGRPEQAGAIHELRCSSGSLPHNSVGIRLDTIRSMEVCVAKPEDDDLVAVPLPGEEPKAEHDRIRRSNDRDQELEREGTRSKHNRGYDEAADGVKTPQVERVVDE
jgi:hypothetical protein